MLPQEYRKHLEPSDLDCADTEAALELVVAAASHANEMMRKLDRYRDVLEVQELLGGGISLVSPSRELMKRVKVVKVASSTGRCEERVLFIFNDLFLLASERTLGLGNKLKLRAVFDPLFTQVSVPVRAAPLQICEGDNLERESSFYLRGLDGEGGPSRCLELICATQCDKNSLMNSIWAVINDVHQRRNSFSTNIFSQNKRAVQEGKACARCETDFAWYSRQGVQCGACRRKYCKKCFGAPRPGGHQCRQCAADGQQPQEKRSLSLPDRQNLLSVPAAEGDVIKASESRLRTSAGKTLDRFLVLRKNFCLYSYHGPNVSAALGAGAGLGQLGTVHAAHPRLRGGPGRGEVLAGRAQPEEEPHHLAEQRVRARRVDGGPAALGQRPDPRSQLTNASLIVRHCAYVYIHCRGASHWEGSN